MSKPPVNVFITETELAEGRKAKRITCLKIEDETLRPVNCVSRPGISTGTLFTRSEKLRTGRYLTDKEMAIMYDKFVGGNSLNNAAVRMEEEERAASVQPSPSSSTSTSSRAPRAGYLDSGNRAPPPPAASVAVAMAAAGCDRPSQLPGPAIDEKAHERAANAAVMKYVAPRIAKKYGITQSITPAGLRAAAAAAAKAAGRGGIRTRIAATGTAGAATADRLLVGGADSTSSVGAGDGRPPRPSSAAFKTTSREQAQRTGSFFAGSFLARPSDTPAPGKYTPKYGAMDKDQHAPLWVRPGAGSATADIAAAANTYRGRPGSAPAYGGGRASRPSSAPTHRSPDDGATDPTVPYDAQAAAAAAAGSQRMPHAQLGQRARPASAGPGFARSLSSRAAAAAGGGGTSRLTMEGRSQLQQRHEELFGLAHRVHEREPRGPPGGTQPFKATERKSFFGPPPPGSPLFGEYYREGYDSLTRKCSRPSSAFHTQSQRQWANGPPGDTGPSLGPGCYGQQPPATNTGRHVPAGHGGLSRTPDWTRTTPRPGSAPPVRPPPASATYLGYYGPGGPTSSLFPDDPEYGELHAIRMLQERASQRTPASPTDHRPAVQQQALGQQGQQAPPAAAPPAAAAGAQEGGGGGGGSPARPLVYVGPDRHGEVTSAGLAKRVPGGAFGTATRERVCQTMRASANNRITPPAAVHVKPSNDLSYDYDISVEGHRGRQPAWHLPPNRSAMSQRWMEAAATAYLS